MTDPAPHPHTANGILIMVLGVFSLCISDAIAKVLTDNYSVLQILFMRNAIAFPFAFAIVYWIQGPSALISRKPVAHLLRGVVWVLAATLFFSSFRYLDLAESTALVFAAPVFITALSATLFKDKVGWRRWSAVVVGFIGVLIVIRPGAGTFQLASLLPITTAFLYAVMMLSARLVDPAESVWTLMLYLAGTGLIWSAVTMPFVWTAPRPEDLWLFAGISLFGTAGATMITQAFRMAPSSLVAPIDYTALLWASLFGWLIWAEIPDMATYAGALVIILSGLFIIFRDAKKTA